MVSFYEQFREWETSRRSKFLKYFKKHRSYGLPDYMCNPLILNSCRRKNTLIHRRLLFKGNQIINSDQKLWKIEGSLMGAT